MKITIDPGDDVICDYCGRDFTNNKESGGIIFFSSAVCPICDLKIQNSIKRHSEEKYIQARCKPDQTFADFVREYRNDQNNIRQQK